MRRMGPLLCFEWPGAIARSRENRRPDHAAPVEPATRERATTNDAPVSRMACVLEDERTLARAGKSSFFEEGGRGTQPLELGRPHPSDLTGCVRGLRLLPRKTLFEARDIACAGAMSRKALKPKGLRSEAGPASGHAGVGHTDE